MSNLTFYNGQKMAESTAKYLEVKQATMHIRNNLLAILYDHYGEKQAKGNSDVFESRYSSAFDHYTPESLNKLANEYIANDAFNRFPAVGVLRKFANGLQLEAKKPVKTNAQIKEEQERAAAAQKQQELEEQERKWFDKIELNNPDNYEKEELRMRDLAIGILIDNGYYNKLYGETPNFVNFYAHRSTSIRRCIEFGYSKELGEKYKNGETYDITPFCSYTPAGGLMTQFSKTR